MGAESLAYSTSNNVDLMAVESSLLMNPWVILTLYLILAIVIIWAVIKILRWYLKNNTRAQAACERVVLLITLPKEAEEVAEKEDTMDKKNNIKDYIAVAETMYANLAGEEYVHDLSYYKKKFITFWIGYHSHISLEIIAHSGVIKFYMVCARYLVEYMEHQVHAHYPTANVEIVPDYNIFAPQGYIRGTYLRLSRSQLLPLKTYKKIDSDPMEGVTNNLTKLNPDEGAGIQILIRPAPNKWRHKALGIARKLHGGKKINEVILTPGMIIYKVVVFPFTIIGKIFNELFSSKEKKEQDLQANKHNEKNPPMRIFQQEEELIKSVEENANKAWFEANIRIVVSSPRQERIPLLLRNMINSFSQFTAHDIDNGLEDMLILRKGRLIRDFIFRNFRESKNIFLSTEELASIYHLPMPNSETPNILWLTARSAPPPVNMPTEGLTLGKSFYRGQDVMVKIKRADRRRHVYVIGKSGMGKSVLLNNMIKQDIAAGEGLCVIDPHGDLVEDVLAAIPPDRIDDVIVFDPADTSRPLALNLLEFDARYPEQKSFVINELINILDKLYDLRQTGGPMFEQYMRNALLLIMSHPESGSTLMEVPKVLADEEFRAFKLRHCDNQPVVDFWKKEAEKAGGEAALANIVPYITSKLTQFTANDLMRPIIGQQHSAFNLRQVMDEGKILLINLSKGKIGDMNAYLLGLVLVGKILMASLSRTDMPEATRRDFYLYIDEFQNFITKSISIILSEARKYRLNLTIAHQYMTQLADSQGKTEIRDAVLGNVGTMIAFKIGVEDAEIIAKEFKPVFNEYDLINVGKYTAYIKLLVDNQSTKAFTLKPLYDPNKGSLDLAYKIKELSRLKYGRDRALVEQEIKDRIKLKSFKNEASQSVENSGEKFL